MCNGETLTPDITDSLVSLSEPDSRKRYTEFPLTVMINALYTNALFKDIYSVFLGIQSLSHFIFKLLPWIHMNVTDKFGQNKILLFGYFLNLV